MLRRYTIRGKKKKDNTQKCYFVFYLCGKLIFLSTFASDTPLAEQIELTYYNYEREICNWN